MPGGTLPGHRFPAFFISYCKYVYHAPDYGLCHCRVTAACTLPEREHARTPYPRVATVGDALYDRPMRFLVEAAGEPVCLRLPLSPQPPRDLGIG
jgi:hypothetical protein